MHRYLWEKNDCKNIEVANRRPHEYPKKPSRPEETPGKYRYKYTSNQSALRSKQCDGPIPIP